LAWQIEVNGVAYVFYIAPDENVLDHLLFIVVPS